MQNYRTPSNDLAVSSPNGGIVLQIKLTDKIYYKIDYFGKTVMWYSPISMALSDGTVLGKNPTIIGSKEVAIDQEITPSWGIRTRIRNHYNELAISFEGNYQVIFRAYDDGIAYRFHTKLSDPIEVMHEEVSWCFLKNHPLLAHVVGDFQTSYEKLYTSYTIEEVVEEEFISLPLLVDQGEVKLIIAEADVFDYPGMYIMKKGNNNRFFLDALFPQYPTHWEEGGLCQFNLRVTERAPYLAQTQGDRLFPWRLIGLAKEDKDLLASDLVYKLARPSKIETDWIKPGKVAWEWWNDWNLKGVDFETGVNQKTYEYYIDFAAKQGLEYIIMDEGWSHQFDLMLQKPGINVPKLVSYAQDRQVGIILWCVWHTLDRQMEEALDLFESWGVRGIKVDFIDRDDQIAINFYERLAAEAAKRHLLVNIHGCSKPTGLHRTYPNVLNYEAVRGNEYNKFGAEETPRHNIDIVYTRMFAGPMDYTPGAMRNSTQGNYLMDFSNPMSHGTRCHQLGMYVVYYSPMQMLCDAPTAYTPFPDILQFLSDVPVTWDESIPLAGKIGEYVVIARRKDRDWYIGALTDWSERTLQVDLSFLADGTYQGTLFLDGVNAHRTAEDYQVKYQTFSQSDSIHLPLKPGGGAAIQLKK